jgi:hypothetical protein
MGRSGGFAEMALEQFQRVPAVALGCQSVNERDEVGYSPVRDLTVDAVGNLQCYVLMCTAA